MDGTKKSRDEIEAYVNKLFDEHPDKFADFALGMQERMAQSVGKEDTIRCLPIEDTIWFIQELETVEDEVGVRQRFMQMNDKRGVGLCINMANPAKKTISQQAYDLFCYCCLFPVTKMPRRPRILTYHDKNLLIAEGPLDLSAVGVYFMSPGRGPPLSTEAIWYRQCSMCAMKGTPDMFKKCGSCESIIYCSKECQRKSWSRSGEMKKHSHKHWCARLKLYMDKTADLAKFPFSYAKETTSLDFHVLACKKFLKNRNLYNKGMWKRECLIWSRNGNDIPFGEIPDTENAFVLQNEGAILNKKSKNILPDITKPFTEWAKYYKYHGFSFDSPIAALLSFPLTLYYIVTTCFQNDFPGRLQTGGKLQTGDKFIIHLVGVEREVEMFTAFQEFGRLLPSIQFQIDMVGNEISKKVDKKHQQLDNVAITCYKGWYHETTLDEPDLAVSLNAGVAAYLSWGAAVKKMKDNETPAYFTDYCQFSCECAKLSLEDCKMGSITEPIINPFRSPLRKVCEESNTPWYSNAFIYRVIYT